MSNHNILAKNPKSVRM